MTTTRSSSHTPFFSLKPTRVVHSDKTKNPFLINGDVPKVLPCSRHIYTLFTWASRTVWLCSVFVFHGPSSFSSIPSSTLRDVLCAARFSLDGWWSCPTWRWEEGKNRSSVAAHVCFLAWHDNPSTIARNALWEIRVSVLQDPPQTQLPAGTGSKETTHYKFLQTSLVSSHRNHV